MPALAERLRLSSALGSLLLGVKPVVRPISASERSGATPSAVPSAEMSAVLEEEPGGMAPDALAGRSVCPWGVLHSTERPAVPPLLSPPSSSAVRPRLPPPRVNISTKRLGGMSF